VSFVQPNEENRKNTYWHYLYYPGLSGPDNPCYSRLVANTDRAGDPGPGISAGRHIVSFSKG